MIDDAVKALWEAIPGASIDNTLFDMKNLKFLLDSFKDYATRLKGKLEK